MYLSEHFTYEEMVASQYATRLGIENTPSPIVLANLTNTAKRLDDVRRRLGNMPILVSSGYRSPRLNVAVGGAMMPPSAHTFGYAVDFICPAFGSIGDVAFFLSKQADLGFDQLILEFEAWVHISFDPRMRRQCLTIRSRLEGYFDGIVPLPRANS